MSFTIHDIAADLASRSSHLADYGRDELKDKYVKRLRHTCAEGLHRITREGDSARAPQLFDKEEACLAALSLLCTEVLDFDVHMQRAILDGARHSLNGESLSGAVAGIAKGEQWALTLKIRASHAGERVTARFVRYENAHPNDATEELLRAYGEPLIGCLVIPLTDIFSTFATAADA